jgi:predicted metalloendopeptidase
VDSTCAPCRDFDRFANGPWTSRTTLPAGYSDYGAFDELYDRNEAVLRRILETALAAPRAKADRNTTMLRDYYGACMDSAGAERDGGRPIVGLLADSRRGSPRRRIPAVRWRGCTSTASTPCSGSVPSRMTATARR